MEDELHLDSREPGPQHNPVLRPTERWICKLCVDPWIFNSPLHDPGHRCPDLRDANVILCILHFRWCEDFPAKPTLQREHDHGATVYRMYPTFDPRTRISTDSPMHVSRCHLHQERVHTGNVHRELWCSRVRVSIWVWRARRAVGDRHRPGMGLLQTISVIKSLPDR